MSEYPKKIRVVDMEDDVFYFMRPIGDIYQKGIVFKQKYNNNNTQEFLVYDAQRQPSVIELPPGARPRR